MTAKASDPGPDHPEPEVLRAPRQPLDAQVEFIVACDVLEAKALNVSESGIAFALSSGLPVELRLRLPGQDRVQRAELVWLKRQPGGDYRLGLRFVPGQAEPTF